MQTEVSLLTFESLSTRVEPYVAATAEEPAGRLERWLFAVGLFAAGAGSLLATLIGGRFGVWIILIAFGIELVGLLGSVLLQVRRTWASFRHAHRWFAKELDGDYALLGSLLADLSRYPLAVIEGMQRFVAHRRNSMTYRLSLFTGGIERLGMLPVIGGVYLQFKDWKFGDWQAIGDSLHLVGGLLLWMLLLIYLAGWHLIRLRVRLDLYEFVLDEARRHKQVSSAVLDP